MYICKIRQKMADLQVILCAWMTLALFGVCAPALAAGGQSQPDFPSRSLRIIVPYAAGGGTDLQAREWAQFLSQQFNQSVIVENKPGANGIIGTAYAAKAPPDGYTVYMATYGFPVVPLLFKQPPYKVSDFSPVIKGGQGPLALVVAKNSPYKNIHELIDAAKKAPGKLNIGTLGNGSQEQMGSQKFQKAAGIVLNEVPYKGGAPAIVDLIGGSIDLIIEGLPTVMGYVRAGTVRALGVTGSTRSAQLPDVTTFKEQGVSDVVVYSWNGFLVPAGTPGPIVEYLNSAFKKGMADKKLVSALTDKFGSELAGGTVGDFKEFLDDQIKDNQELIERLAITLQ